MDETYMNHDDQSGENPEELNQANPESAGMSQDVQGSESSQPIFGQDGAYSGAGTGRRESPYADSPYVMYHETQRQTDNQTYDWVRSAPVEPAAPKKSREKKTRHGWKPAGIVAAALCCALLGGIGGGALMLNYSNNRMAQQTEALQSQLDALKRSQNSASTAINSGTNASGSTVSTGSTLTFSQVYEQNVNSVVAISNESTSTNIFGQPSTSASSGSGFVISEDGYILTNYHVVKGATSLTVMTYDGTEYSAVCKGYDSSSDVALLKVEASGLDAVVIGDSDALQVGEAVAAIGNPLGELTSSLTAGYVSALDRMINTDGTVLNMLQTDAAINPGNSGGPLFNMKGEVIGITTAKYSGSTSSGASIEGIGFAIPINDVMSLVNDLMEYGYAKNRPYLGVTLREMDASVGAMYNLPVGPQVQEVTDGSCAQKAGVQAGDIIIGLGDTKIESYSELAAALKNFSAGDTVKLTVYRSGREVELQVVLDERPQTTDSSDSNQQTQPQQGQESGGQSGQESQGSDSWEDMMRRFFGFGG